MLWNTSEWLQNGVEWYKILRNTLEWPENDMEWLQNTREHLKMAPNCWGTPQNYCRTVGNASEWPQNISN